MDLLDNYKKAWENQPEDAHKVSKNEIFKMMHAKSSSIVKWIFIIGLCEFVLLAISYLLFDYEKIMTVYDDLGLKNFVLISSFIVVPFLIYFLYQFYRNYKNISVTENTISLMNKILKTRKTVKNYILFNLIYFMIILITVFSASINKHSHEINLKLIIVFIIALSLTTCLFWLFYQLLYGILLRKLNKNYKELAKLDALN